MSSRSFAHASHCRQVDLELRLGPVERCRVAVGAMSAGLPKMPCSDQNQRMLSGPPRCSWMPPMAHPPL